MIMTALELFFIELHSRTTLETDVVGDAAVRVIGDIFELRMLDP